ncbi:MAG: hypothetical protein FJX73_03235 [Armatimonadetes bacterium]|nr:hypothetical protein [Armatimonadota bacterium]
MIRCASAGFVIWLAVAAPALSQGSPEPLLDGVTLQEVARHAAIASQIVDYEGTKVLSVLRGEAMETVTLIETRKRPGRTRLEFLSPEGVAGRLVVDDGLQTWHYEPRLHTVFQGPSLAPPTDAPPVGWLSEYHLRLLGVEDVIGRRTAVLSLRPRSGQGERRLWIDRTTGVALRAEERDPSDGPVMVAYFTRISFGLNVPSALFHMRPPAGARIIGQGGPVGPLLALPDLERAVGFALSVPRTLPGGYSLRGGTPVRHGPLLTASLDYSDGSRSLVLFVVPAGRARPPGRGEAVPVLGPGARAFGAGAIRIVTWENQGRQLALAGALPMMDLTGVAAVISKGSGP